MIKHFLVYLVRYKDELVVWIGISQETYHFKVFLVMDATSDEHIITLAKSLNYFIFIFLV